MTLSSHSAWLRASASIPVLGLALAAAPGPAGADETCQSPYMAKITGHEEFVYVWTLGVDGLGDGSDKVVTIDVRPDSSTFGEVVDVDSVGGRHEAHHGDFTDDRRFFWVSGLDTSNIFAFDVHSNPADPKLVKTIDDFVEKSGVVGPHGAYALPGRMMISGSPTPRIIVGAPAWSSTPTTASTSRRTGCPSTGTGTTFAFCARVSAAVCTVRGPASSTRTATATTRASCRAKTLC
jgi:hypothetical protein